MKPTDEVDDLLTQAGARWRADQPSAPEPDLDRILGGRRRPRTWVPALAAASVAAIAAAALTVLPGAGKEPVAGPSASADTPQSVAKGNQARNDNLLVRNGDRVQVSGQVIAVPGKEPVFCPPLPTRAIGWPKGEEPAPSCPAEYAVTLKGVDLDELGAAETIKDVRTGYATIIGIWTDRTIKVLDQTAQTRSATAELNVAPDEVPCPAPSGGWKPVASNADDDAVTNLLAARESQTGTPRLLYPKGRAPGAPMVLTIGVAHGDPAAFRREIEKVYDGNLCVHRIRLSRADLARIVDSVSSRMPKELGVYGYGAGSTVDKVSVSALVYDEAVKAVLAPAGLDNFALDVAVEPVR